MKSFESFGLSERTLDVLTKKGYEMPTKIQELVIPVVMEGDDDIVAQAQTGTGKTAAFGIPLIELLPEKSRTVQALVLTPTRELAIQVAEEINSLKGLEGAQHHTCLRRAVDELAVKEPPEGRRCRRGHAGQDTRPPPERDAQAR